MSYEKLCTRDLTTLICIESQVGAKDGVGGITSEWTTAWEVWAKVEPKKGVEKDAANRLQSEVFFDVTIRYDRAIRVTNAMRVRIDEPNGFVRYLKIRAAIDVEYRHDALQLVCVEGVSVA